MTDNLKYKIILGFAAIYIIWGSTYLAIRIGVETIPPFLMASIRFLIAGVLFYLYGIIKKVEKPKAKDWVSTAIVGILLLVGGNGLVSWAEEVVPSGIAALLIAMVPLWIVLFDAIHPQGSSPSKKAIGGLILGFIGVAALINPTDIGGFAEIDQFGAMLLIFATIFWASGSIFAKYTEMPKSLIVASGMQMLVAGIVLLLLSIVTGELNGFNYESVTFEGWMSLLYLITFGSVGYGAYIWLLQVTDPSKVATYAYVNPVIALLLGSLIASETISLWTIGCSLFILIAVFIIISSKKKTTPSEVSINKPDALPAKTKLKGSA